LVSHIPKLVDTFHGLLAQTESILDAFKTTGDADYMLKVAVGDLSGLNQLISLLSAHESVGHVKTSVVLERLKENTLMTTASA
jgi:DNA-binding Lrp family transcriptional regulator